MVYTYYVPAAKSPDGVVLSAKAKAELEDTPVVAVLYVPCGSSAIATHIYEREWSRRLQ